MIIRNMSKSVKVFKALGHVPLRILPGYNEIGEIDPKPYFAGNKAAKAMFKTYMTTHDEADLDEDSLVEAAKAKKKNDDLNRAYKVLKAKDVKLEENKTTITDQAKMIKEQSDLIAEMQKRLAKLETKK